MGLLSYEPRGNLTLFTGIYYKAEYGGYQENSEIREGIPSRKISVLCFDFAQHYAEQVPLKAGRVEACPVIFVFEPPNSLASKMLGIVRFKPMAGSIGKINQAQHYRHFGKHAYYSSKRCSAL